MSDSGDCRQFIARCMALTALFAALLPHICPAALRVENGMVFVLARRITVGTSDSQRTKLARRFDCHLTWLGDDLPQQEIDLPAFWIDRYPVTNAEYLAFVEATGHSRPSWWGRWAGLFPAECANHPVAGVSGMDAAAYAKWAGKRLPTAAGWEAAAAGPDGSIFAWGNNWPGPIKPRKLGRIYWELPATQPVGAGRCGKSLAGIEDFAGQVLEWTSNTIPHHGVRFQLAKAASWFHQDGVNFRIASGWYAYEGWRSSFTGFRCATDAVQPPPQVKPSIPKKTISTAEALKQLETATDGPIEISAAGGNSRHLSIRVPYLGPETLSLTAPETIIWNGAGVMTWRKTPDMTWLPREPKLAQYEMRFDELLVRAHFIVRGDYLEQQFTAKNLTNRPGSFRTSACFNLQNHPMFYDCEQLRTYILTAKGKFVAMRNLSRSDNCVRWITGPNASEWGPNAPYALLAVVSRDEGSVIATGRSKPATAFSAGTNTLFTCLHTDSTVQVPPNDQASTRQYFYFLKGSLEDLLIRFREQSAE